MAETTENKGAEVTAESKETAKAIAKIAYDKRGFFAYLVREIYTTVKAEIEENTKAKEDTLAKFFDGKPEEVAEQIAELYPEVYDAIKSKVIENIDEDDLDSDTKDRIAEDYIRGNEDEVARDCFNRMGNYDRRDFVKDCIDDL